jgi:hypothetical protein
MLKVIKKDNLKKKLIETSQEISQTKMHTRKCVEEFKRSTKFVESNPA